MFLNVFKVFNVIIFIFIFLQYDQRTWFLRVKDFKTEPVIQIINYV